MQSPPRVIETLHLAARLEDATQRVLTRALSRRGWRPRLVAYTGYGADGWVRVLGRVLLTPPGESSRDPAGVRGWRHFFSVKVAGAPVTVEVGDSRHEVITARGGYVDADVPGRLAPGWREVRLSVSGHAATVAAVRVVGADERLGLVSDIDDTVIVTALPRPLVAFWNTFVRHERSRQPVPGMARLYGELLRDEPGALVVYVSTGAWNAAPTLARFLDLHGFPRGPLLMTDWGPTHNSWFRSGRTHKRATLARLLAELPALGWILVGDDGQHDPQIYDETALAAPERVRLVAIRQLSPAEQILTHGTPTPKEPAAAKAPRAAPGVPQIHAPDGFGLIAALRARGLSSAASPVGDLEAWPE